MKEPSVRAAAATTAAIAATMAAILLGMGQTFLGPDGRFGFWEGNIWSAANSQRFADPYSFSHVGHGLVFFGLLWAAARKLPLRSRFLVAALLEAGWEILENSPIIIQRYRESTIAQGYSGDSVLNSLSDLLMMSLGFALAAKAKPWQSLAVFLAMEIGCLFWIRDNLILNVLMLICPIEGIKAWQVSGKP
jgi:hypothetical protein